MLIVLLVLVVLGTGAGGVYLYAIGASGPSRPVTVEIPEGATATEVSEILERAEVVRSALGFRFAARTQGLGTELQAGTYELTTNMSVDEAIAALRAGPVVETVQLTVPEGLELPQVAEVAAETFAFEPKDFERAATSGSWSLAPYLPRGVDTLEGFLFPSTYEFAPHADVEQVIGRLLDQFESEASGLPWDRAEQLGLTPYEVVIVASLIEREARVEEDRAKISAVIHNRLEEGMPLQIDATVQYALPEPNRPLRFEDYEYQSPYNTYLHPGLPPTPIASPGRGSLEAALRPADEDYLFFVVIDPETGEHGFAETYDEFLRLKDQAGL